MGPLVPGGPHVDVRFKVGYALLSWSRGSWRVTARLDGFHDEDRDGTAEPDAEAGSAVTVAAFWKPRDFVRLGLEYVEVRGERAAASGVAFAIGGRCALLEVRLLF